MLKAVIFDSDGTLINSFELILAAYDHVARTNGLRPPTADDLQPLLAKAVPVPGIYASLYPDADSGKLVADNGDFIAKHANRAAAFAGIHEMLQGLESMGLLLAVVTGGGHKVRDVLAHNKIDRHFASIVHFERVTHGKPNPEGVFLALEELGVEAKDAVMVGDSMNDILAGKNAGLRCNIGVTHGHGVLEDLRAAGADYVVDSLDEVLTLVRQLHN